MARLIGLAAVFIACAVMHTSAAVETNCTVRTTGTSGQLICQFSTDISKQRSDFLVQRYDLDGTDQEPELVINCRWLVRRGLDCDIAQGYHFDMKVWNMLVIDIPTFSRRYDGKYMCQVPGNVENKKDNTCEYEYTGRSSVTPANTTPASTNIVQNDEKSLPVDHKEEMILLLRVIVALLALIIVDRILIYGFKCYRHIKGKPDTLLHWHHARKKTDNTFDYAGVHIRENPERSDYGFEERIYMEESSNNGAVDGHDFNVNQRKTTNE